MFWLATARQLLEAGPMYNFVCPPYIQVLTEISSGCFGDLSILPQTFFLSQRRMFLSPLQHLFGFYIILIKAPYHGVFVDIDTLTDCCTEASVQQH